MRTYPVAMRVVMKVRGITYRELAEKAGSNLNYLCLVARGHCKASPDLIRRIAEALDVDPSLLAEHQGQSPGRPKVKKDPIAELDGGERDGS